MTLMLMITIKACVILLKTLKFFSQENIDKIIFVCLNINSVRNKIDQLSSMIEGHTDVRMASEPKMDNIFPNGLFLIESYGAPFRLHFNKLGGGIIYFVRIDIPAKLFSVNIGFETFFVEFNFRKRNGY